MNTKLTEREKLDEVLDLIRAAYGKNYEEYKVIGRKLIVPDNSKTYSRVFDIPSVLAGMTRSRKGRSTFGFLFRAAAFHIYHTPNFAFLFWKNITRKKLEKIMPPKRKRKI